MQDLLKEESNRKILTQNISGYKYETSSPSVAQNISLNITNIIDEVKKQRMDIIRLNNELRNSKGLIDTRENDEVRTRADMAQTIRNLQREKEQLQLELKSLKEIMNVTDSKVREKDSLIYELRAKNSENLRQLSDKQSDIDNLKYSLNRMQVALEDKDKNSNTHVHKELLDEVELKMKSYSDKYKAEAQKSAKLNLDLEENKQSLELMVADNERLNEKLKQYMEMHNKLKQEFENLKHNKQIGISDELTIDYNFLKRLKDNMDLVIENLSISDA